ncbi:MAG: ABC transporter permease [Candidatus Aenigmarchaeota archaeon]|nr:ABC transporter permease [Candidatus Aenigmarchaeota archaeon]
MRVIPFLAFKDMKRDKKIVVLVVFLLAFSYINMTFFPAFLNGLSDTFQSEIVDTGTSHIIIQPSLDSNEQYLNFESSIRKKIDLIPGVVKSSAHLYATGTAYYENKQSGIRIEGTNPSDDIEVTTISQKLLRGDYLSDDDDEIVVGEYIAGRKIEDSIGKNSAFGRNVEGLGGVDVGQKIKIKFSNGVEKEYKIKGIVGSEGFSFVSQTVYISKREADSVLGISDKASAILVKLNDKNSADKYKKLILELGIANADIETWQEASSFVNGINQTFGIVITITTMVGIIIVMATVGIVIFINTTRKRRIIGVLKAIGMQKNQILGVFLFEALFFGILGTLLGLAIVYSIVFYLTINPIVVPIGYLKPILPLETAINAVVILLVSSVIAGYVPSRMASKQEVLENIKTVE